MGRMGGENLKATFCLTAWSPPTRGAGGLVAPTTTPLSTARERGWGGALPNLFLGQYSHNPHRLLLYGAFSRLFP